MSYLATGMMHQIQSFSLFLRKITSCLVLAENQFSQLFFFKQSDSVKRVTWKAILKYFFPVFFYAVWLAWLTFQSSKSNVTDCSLLPSFHSCIVLGPQTQTPHKSRRKMDSFPFAPPFKKYQFCTVPLSGMSQNTSVRPYIIFQRQLQYFNVRYYRERIRSSVQPEHSSNLATKRSRATRVGSSLRDVLDSEILSQVSAKNLKYQKRLHMFIFPKMTATKTRK